MAVGVADAEVGAKGTPNGSWFALSGMSMNMNSAADLVFYAAVAIFAMVWVSEVVVYELFRKGLWDSNNGECPDKLARN